MFVIFSSLIVGTKTGYRLYSLNSVDKLENIYESGKMNLLANLKKKIYYQKSFYCQKVHSYMGLVMRHVAVDFV